MQILKRSQIIDSDLPADDIDILCSQLQMIEPPPTLTVRILEQLPARTPALSLFVQPVSLPSFDDWAAQDKQRKLC